VNAALPLLGAAVVCTACAAAPAPSPSPPSWVRWHEAWACEREVPAASVVVDTASQWREAAGAWPPWIAQRSDVCDFAVERAVVLSWPGPWTPPLAFTLVDEEDVDVLTVTPRLDATGRSRGIGCALVVPAGARPLAIVVRAPMDAPPAETTLGVFTPR
jgi:hypothetical protein